MAYTNLCGKKLQSKLGGCLNESATFHSPALLSSQQSFAKRQLEKMGWEEGTGLGKRRNGIQEHVKIKQRDDEVGLGREKEIARGIGNVWWKDSVGGTLAKLQLRQKEIKEKKRKKIRRDDDGVELNQKKRRKEKRKKSVSSSVSGDDDSSSKDATTIKSYTDEELFQATGGARFGMRAQRRAEGKWKRTESGSNLVELEKKAMTNIEWNGRGNAQLAGVAVVATAVEGKKVKSSTEKEGEAARAEEEICVVSSVSHPASHTKRKCADDANANEGDGVIVAADSEQGSKQKKKKQKKAKKVRKSEKASRKLHKISPSASEAEADEEGLACIVHTKTATQVREVIEKTTEKKGKKSEKK